MVYGVELPGVFVLGDSGEMIHGPGANWATSPLFGVLTQRDIQIEIKIAHAHIVKIRE